MGAVQSQRAGDSKGHEQPPSLSTFIPRCDVGQECYGCDLSRTDALTDQECVDIMLSQAVMRGDLQDMQRALAKGAQVNTIADITLNMGIRDRKRVKKVTPLMRACEYGHEEVVSRLLEVRADPLRQDTRQWIALCYALGAGELGAARRLISETNAVANEQKDIVMSLRHSVLEQCEEDVGEEVVAEVSKELGPGGFLWQQGGKNARANQNGRGKLHTEQDSKS
uniref:Uncharacterized protein n=1 Tax=Pyrodinium bahamense TaxID=73915 RepID=A0A7S0B7T2_9DINO|mmetsp:Transcript_5394/g.15025  ORF Transcript_5394/g.15025 Transcript_5394/m.15025 type:complete len:224 (+) Transcript_5394:63-734(+)